MTRNYAFQTLDVFSDRSFAGNPLAIFSDAEGMDAALMQQLAAEMNLSETVYVLPADDPANHARLRIFHRTAEMPFAGHPTIGAAALLARTRWPDAATLRLELPAGIAVAAVERDGAGKVARVSIDAPLPFARLEDYPPAPIASCLGLDDTDLITTVHPPTRATTGVEFIMVETTLAALDRAAPRLAAFERLAQLGGHRDRYSLFLYARRVATGVPDAPLAIEARMFAPLSGTWEDPGTGSASSILAALILSETTLDGLRLAIRQGQRMGRPCHIRAEARRDGEKILARVGGQCVPMFAGHFPVRDPADEGSGR